MCAISLGGACDAIWGSPPRLCCTADRFLLADSYNVLAKVRLLHRERRYLHQRPRFPRPLRSRTSSCKPTQSSITKGRPVDEFVTPEVFGRARHRRRESDVRARSFPRLFGIFPSSYSGTTHRDETWELCGCTILGRDVLRKIPWLSVLFAGQADDHGSERPLVLQRREAAKLQDRDQAHGLRREQRLPYNWFVPATSRPPSRPQYYPLTRHRSPVPKLHSLRATRSNEQSAIFISVKGGLSLDKEIVVCSPAALELIPPPHHLNAGLDAYEFGLGISDPRPVPASTPARELLPISIAWASPQRKLFATTNWERDLRGPRFFSNSLIISFRILCFPNYRRWGSGRGRNTESAHASPGSTKGRLLEGSHLRRWRRDSYGCESG